MAENWLYDITLRSIERMHSLKLEKLLGFRKKISLPLLANVGTPLVQVDIVAADLDKKVLVLSECKEFLTFQGASECAEQLSLKTFLLRKYPPNSLSRKYPQIFDQDSRGKYRLIQYVSLGSYSGNKYKNAICNSKTELDDRLAYFRRYMNSVNRSRIGLILFLDRNSAPTSRNATIQRWIN